MITFGDDRYPDRLRELAQAPRTLYYQGDVSLLSSEGVAIVGTRQPTPLGCKVAHAIASFFASEGYSVVSGLAVGCDRIAHKAALSVAGKTIAVLGSSLDAIYPAENRGLARDIVRSGGLLVTAYADTIYDPSRFPERDKVIAALSCAVIPIQAGKSSGTRHACRAAIRLGRPVFVPAPVASDEEQYPEKYALIRQLMRRSECLPFKGRQEYNMLLDVLRR